VTGALRERKTEQRRCQPQRFHLSRRNDTLKNVHRFPRIGIKLFLAAGVTADQ
jgi:hypothetical protein